MNSWVAALVNLDLPHLALAADLRLVALVAEVVAPMNLAAAVAAGFAENFVGAEVVDPAVAEALLPQLSGYDAHRHG